MEELANARLKEQFRLADGIGEQENGAGSEEIENRVQNGLMTRPSFDPSVAGSSLFGLAVGLVGPKRAIEPLSQGPSMGKLLKGVVADGVGPEVGLSCSKGKEWATIEVNASPIGPFILLRDSPGPFQTQLTASGLSLKVCSSVLIGTCKGCNLELEFIMMREKEDRRKQ